MDRQDWLAERRKAITASDAAAILGLNPSRPPIAVWIEKMHPEMVENSDIQELLDFGLDVEPALARAYERKTGLKIERPGFELVHHDKYPEISCTIDGISRDPRKLVQFKWETRFSDKFGAPNTDEVPDAYLIQCGVEMAVWGCEFDDIATMHAGPPLLIYPLHRDLELENMVVDRLRAWWSDYIINKREPAIDASHDWSAYLGKKYPRPSGKMQTLDGAPESIVQAVPVLRDARKLIKAKQEEYDQAANLLKDFIGEADGLVLPDGARIMWTAVKEAEVKAFTRKAYRKFEIRERRGLL